MEHTRRILTMCLLIICVGTLHGYETYQNKIPNGRHVPNPCKPGGIWDGVGHNSPVGNGPRNPFGRDLEKSADHIWASICHLDSDQDGRTNGEELGDPDCNWTPTQPSNLTTDTPSHPGICDPISNETCQQQNSWLKCVSEYTCNGASEPEVKSFNIQVYNESVPANETNYLCKYFPVPNDQNYDIIGAEILLDNKKVLHHMVLYGCDVDDPNFNSSRDIFTCFMNTNTGCRGMISAFAAWDPSVNAFCLPRDVGVRIGDGGYTYLMIQYHWTNFDLASDLTDSSGLKLYYTQKLRPKTAGMLMVGQIYIDIAAGEDNSTFSGGCTSDCSRHRITDHVNIIETLNHMHYLGQEQYTDIYRNGSLVKRIGHENNFDYNNPKFYRFDEPFKLLPGDNIRTTCRFNASKTTKRTEFGLGTADEMCFVFIRYFPLSNLPLKEGGCSQWKSVPLCKIHTSQSYTIDGCTMKNQSPTDTNITSHFHNILQTCQTEQNCSANCYNAVKPIADHACLNNDIGDFVKKSLKKQQDTARVLDALAACKDKHFTVDNGDKNVVQTTVHANVNNDASNNSTTNRAQWFDPEHGGKVKVVLEADRPTEDYVVTSSYEEVALWYPFVLHFLFPKQKKDPTKASKPCLFVFDGNKLEQDQEEYLCFLAAKKALEQLGIPCLWPGDDVFGTQIGALAMLDIQPGFMLMFARNGAQNMLAKNINFINIFANLKGGQKALIFFNDKSKNVVESFEHLKIEKLFFEVEGNLRFGYLKWATTLRELKIIESEDVVFGEARTVNKIAIAVACIICLPFSIILVVLACACLCFSIDIVADMEKTCCKPKPNQVQHMDG